MPVQAVYRMVFDEIPQRGDFVELASPLPPPAQVFIVVDSQEFYDEDGYLIRMVYVDGCNTEEITTNLPMPNEYRERGEAG